VGRDPLLSLPPPFHAPAFPWPLYERPPPYPAAWAYIGGRPLPRARDYIWIPLVRLPPFSSPHVPTFPLRLLGGQRPTAGYSLLFFLRDHRRHNITVLRFSARLTSFFNNTIKASVNRRPAHEGSLPPKNLSRNEFFPFSELFITVPVSVIQSRWYSPSTSP